MKTLCVALACSWAAVAAVAQDGSPAVPQPPQEMEIFKHNVGLRTGQMTAWMQGAGQDPIVVPVKETNTLEHNGFWVATEFEAGPFRGSGLTGYDPYKKKYVGTWVDNMAPVLNVMEGTYDEKTHELTMLFSGRGPDGKPIDMKSVGSEGKQGSQTFAMYVKDEQGKWVKSFEIRYDAMPKSP